MRSNRRTMLLLPLAAAFAIGLSATAMAGGSRHHDRVYADSFGNLVVESAAGYKRIIIGQGHLAKELSDYTRANSPEVVYLDDDEHAKKRDCRHSGVLLKGRSYMYGLSDGELPFLTRRCR